VRITNKTRWRSDDLKKICTAAARAVGISTKGWRLLVSYSKGGVVRPYVYNADVKRAQVCVPSIPKAWPTIVDRIATVETGSAPADMIEGIFRGAIQSFNKSWTPVFVPPPDGLLLRVEETPKKDAAGRISLKRKKLEGLKARAAKWTSKLRRAQVALKKLNREITSVENAIKKMEAT